MKAFLKSMLLVFFLLPVVALTASPAEIRNRDSSELPVAGMVTLIDLGAGSCIPCKMMAPVLERLEKKYRDRAAIVFIDIRKDKDPATRFGIKAIPTQIFFDPEGKEIYRHVGYMSEKNIVSQLKKMGVE